MLCIQRERIGETFSHARLLPIEAISLQVWGNAQAVLKETGTVASAAVYGKARPELLKEAVNILLASAQVDRVGVWAESAGEALGNTTQISVFRGLVAEKEGNAVPAEWCKLSPQPPLPPELLTGLRSVQQDLSESHEHPMIGPLVEMRRVLWVPVKTRGLLRGVVFAGSRNRKAYLNRPLLEAVAAELALTIDLDDERSLNRVRQEDARRVLAALGNSDSPAEILATVVRDCTSKGREDGAPTAVFAAVGRLTDSPRNSKSLLPPSAPSIRFTWQSGSPAWIRALESEPLHGVWSRAIETCRPLGSEPANASPLEEVARVVALPLRGAGETLGVLVAGIQRLASLAALERLELSAALAASALVQLKHGDDTAEQEMRHNALLSAVDAATIEVHPDGTVKKLSDGAIAWLNKSKSAPPWVVSGTDPPESFADFFSPLNTQRVKVWLQRVFSPAQAFATTREKLPDAELRNGARVCLQALFPTKDGGAGILLETLPQRSGYGEGQHGLAEILNVIEWLEEGVVLFGTKEEIRAVNSRFAQIIGLVPSELAGLKTFNDLVSALGARTADAGAFAESGFSLPGHTDGALREELQLLRPVPRLLERAARPILDETGAYLGRVEIYRDLTAQRVFQFKLLQTDKLAELGQMVTGIAHELSNPLTSILGYAQRLLLRRDTAGDCQEARQIFQEAERASAILRQLLLSARESRPERRRLALNQVISRTLELQRFSLAADNVHVRLDLEPALPFVQGDAGQLQQVLMNLIGNARQAIEEQGKGGTIFVKTKRIAEKRVLLEVRDDGPGIPQAIQARIFDPFFTTKPAGVGTGLGLAIVLGIVREHGGRLHLTSNPGEGTAFSIELPALDTLEMASPLTGAGPILRPRLKPPPAPQPLETAQAGAALSAWAGTRVLVLEDEPTVARLIADVLEDEGLRVDVLLDSREALERATREEYALVVCDMKMPELDGEHFYQALARSKNPLHKRFLFVTGDVLAARTRDFLDRNHLPHVAKPFRVEELTEKIRGLLEANLPRESLRAPAAKKNAARK